MVKQSLYYLLVLWFAMKNQKKEKKKINDQFKT